MAVESRVVGPAYAHGTSSTNSDLYYIASAISSLANYNIIDSYSLSAVPNRYKGDPIADGVWTGPGSVSGTNSWIVIEPSAPTNSPAWQAKIQIITQWNSFDDPSGHDYGFEGATWGTIYWRFSPYGGWSLADTGPDFDSGVSPATQVTPNYQTTSWVVTTGKYLLTCDEDTLILMGRFTTADYSFQQLVFYFGDYVPKSVTQSGAKARCAIACNTVGQYLMMSSLTSDSSLTNEEDPNTASTRAIPMCFLDPDDVMQRRYIGFVPFESFTSPYSQPNRFPSPYDLDLAPLIVRGGETRDTSTGPGYDAIIGELRLIAKTYSPGVGTIFGGSTWLALSQNYGTVVRWDGTVAPY